MLQRDEETSYMQFCWYVYVCMYVYAHVCVMMMKTEPLQIDGVMMMIEK